jgi:hypothetical protein
MLCCSRGFAAVGGGGAAHRDTGGVAVVNFVCLIGARRRRMKTVPPDPFSTRINARMIDDDPIAADMEQERLYS